MSQYVHDLFSRRAEEYAAATAVHRGDDRWSYRELEDRSNRLANYLLERAGDRGDVLVLLSADHAEVITAMLAALKAGVVFAPLHPRFPRRRLQAMSALAQPRWILTDPPLLPVVRTLTAALGSRPEILSTHATTDGTPEACDVVDLPSALALQPADRPAVPRDPDDLAYLCFTSGSTGTPKAIAGRLQGIDHFVRWEIETFGIGAGTRVSQLTTPSFDAFLRDAFVPLCAGGTVCIPPTPRDIADGRRLAQWIDHERLQVVHCVPSLLRAMLREPLPPDAFAFVHCVLVAGERLLPGDVRRWMDAVGDRVQLVNLYGPSETTMTKLWHRVRPADADAVSVPIGTPMDGAIAMVVDPEGRPCPADVVGEICIRTPYRTLGYYRQPELTDRVFVRNPNGEDPDEPVYRTGDLGRVAPDGLFHFVGRSDQQVKILGHRVEPGEIEVALSRHRQVQEAAVVDHAGRTGEPRLIAYVVANASAQPSADELRSFLRDDLPDHMLPAECVLLDRLPTTTHGKVDRSQLRPPMTDDERAVAPPRTPLERELVDLWRRVLRVDDVGVHDQFLTLGGNSLKATRLINELQERLDHPLELSTLFESPTVAALADRLLDRHRIAAERLVGRGGPATRRPTTPRTPRDGLVTAPASFSQRRMWFLQRVSPRPSLYTMFSGLRLNGPLDIPALHSSLDEIVRRHASLRTTFRGVDGDVQQVIAPPTGIALPREDLPPSDDPETAVMRRAREEARLAFDLERGPLFRARLLHVEPERHVLLLTMHHIVSDDWSMDILYRELTVLYGAHLAGRASPLRPLTAHSTDHACWEREHLSSSALHEGLAYWRTRLGENRRPLDLPTDHPRPAEPTDRGARESATVDPPLLSALRTLSREEQATLFMTVASAFNLLLARYTGADDVMVGVPVSGRYRRDFEDLIGVFLNTVVLRVDLSGEPTFRGLIGRVRRRTLEAYDHQAVPIEKVVEALRGDRDVDRHRLFPAYLNMVEAPALDLDRLDVEFFEVPLENAKFDLTLHVVEHADHLSVRLNYASDLFEAGTIRRMLDHFVAILHAIAEDADRPIYSLARLSGSVRRQLLVDWNDTRTDVADERCLHELFEAQADRTPDAVALVSGDRRLAYREVNDRANQLAHWLLRQGIQAEEPVAIVAERSFELVLAMLATLKAGGAYLLLDPSTPPHRRASLLDATGPRFLLTPRPLADAPAGSHVRAFDLVADWEAVGGERRTDPGRPVHPRQLAYVMYTSGSTGTPQGVMVEHGGLRNHWWWMHRTFPMETTDTVLQVTAAYTDASVWDFYGPLLSGARLVLAPEGPLDPDAIVETIRARRVTNLKVVPSLLRVLVDHPQFETCISLRRVFCGGEVLTNELADRLLDRVDVSLHNLYGPTEATIDATAWTHDRRDDGAMVPIGRPLDNVQVFVLDRRGGPVPIGVPGELYVGGAGLARGYWHQPARTAERFVPHPFPAAPGDRLYRTGDVARYRPDGRLEYLGRTDRQVKIRGFRIEPAEVEATLNRHATVAASAVVARTDEAGHTRLVAYVVDRDSASPSAEALRDYLAERLPDAMVPSRFVKLPALPLTRGGKVDRNALPEPEPSRAGLGNGSAPPRKPIELTLAAIWADLLGIERLGIHDNFFAVGGDSIVSIQVVARAREAGLHVTPQQMFRHPTIAELASVVASVTTAPVVAEQGPATGTVPLTPIQHWFFEQESPEPHHFNQAILDELPADVTPGLLREAWSCLLQHHDAMRLRFTRSGTVWHQSYAPRVEPTPFESVDLSRLAPDAQRSALETTVAGVHRSLDLERGPLTRMVHFGLGPERPDRLLIVAHHLVVDGVSWRILQEDLRQAYGQLRAAEAVRLPPKSWSFGQWSRRIQAEASSSTAELHYWLDLPWGEAGDLPLDDPDGVNLVGTAQTISAALEADETRALLQEVPAAYNTRINDVLLTALAQAFEAWTGHGAMLVDLEGHGRDALDDTVDVSRTVGWFTSLHPLLLRGGSRDAGAALASTKEQLRSVPRRGVGFGLLRYLHPDRRVATQLRALAHPLVKFNYMGQFDRARHGDLLRGPAGEYAGPSRSPRTQRSHVLSIEGRIVGGRLRTTWTHGRQLRPTTVARLADGYVAALRRIIDHCREIGSTGYTPSDFPQSGLDQAALNTLVSRLTDRTPEERAWR